MQKIVRVLAIIALATLFILILPACNKIKDVSFFVSGDIVSDIEFSRVQIFINNKKSDYAVNADGSFLFDNLSSGDEIEFYLEGYEIDPVIITNYSVEGLMVTAKPLSFTISVEYDKGAGVVTGCGNYCYNSNIELTFAPAPHYSFDGLFDGETLVETEGNAYHITVLKNKTYTAKFSKISYPISFTKNFPLAIASATQTACFGDNVVLDATDNNDYVFSKWIVNGTEITDKHYEFSLDNEITMISAIFLQRLKAPVLSANGNCVSWQDDENVAYYKAYIDGELVFSEKNNKIDLSVLNLYSGKHDVEVVAVAEEYANSPSATLTVDYVRRLDSPKNSGILINEESIYYVFSKVLGASGYEIEVNGKGKKLSSFIYFDNGNEIYIDLSTVLKEPAEYIFAVTALGATTLQNSEKTAFTDYIYNPPLNVPTASIENNVLKWSHEDTGVLFNVIISGVKIKSGVGAGSLNLVDLIESNEAEISIVAKKDGWSESSLTIHYIKE